MKLLNTNPTKEEYQKHRNKKQREWEERIKDFLTRNSAEREARELLREYETIYSN